MKPGPSIALALCCSCALAFAACGRFVEIKSLVLAGVPSPGGKLMAYSYQTEPWGGPLADYSYRISILPSDSFAKPWERGEIVWAGGELEPLYFFWVDDHSLEVLLRPGTKNLKTVSTPSENYTVTTRVLQSTRKSDIVGSPGVAEP